MSLMIPEVVVPISPQVVAACAIAEPVETIPTTAATAATRALFPKLEMILVNVPLLVKEIASVCDRKVTGGAQQGQTIDLREAGRFLSVSRRTRAMVNGA